MKGFAVALIGVLGMVLGSLIISDLDRCLPSIAVWIVRRRTARLPPGLRERMEEEWLAVVDRTTSHFRKLLFAVGLFIGRAELIRAYQEPKVPRANSQQVRGNVNVKLTGVSSVGAVGTVVEAVGTAAGSAHIASTAQLFPPSISMDPPSSK